MNFKNYCPVILFFDEGFDPMLAEDIDNAYAGSIYALVLSAKPDEIKEVLDAIDDAGYVYDGLEDAAPGWYSWQRDPKSGFYKWYPFKHPQLEDKKDI